MKVTIREKALADGRKSLYLDFYPPIPHPQTGKDTRREYLNLYVFDKPRTPLDRTHNKETLELAENTRAKRQIDAQNGQYGFLVKRPVKTDFVEYFTEQVEAYSGRSKGAKWGYRKTARLLTDYCNNKPLRPKEVTRQFCEGFRGHLETLPEISHNTAALYFTYFKTILKRAVVDGFLDAEPQVKPIKEQDAHREFLTMEELIRLSETGTQRPDLKQGALFSALTGLRFSDVAALTWQQIHKTAEGYSIRLRIQKTQRSETIPISDEARALLGEEGVAADRIFPRLNYTVYLNNLLKMWVKEAGIDRKITFHCFRHTFATLQLLAGTDIYTVSKLLSHKNLSTTQIYAKVVDQTKRDAVNRLSLAVKVNNG
ncbi:tyrosine-type recombinase/integrase [Fibrella arboris]|uniref:tyrosine-type recombinase/integrase n=1 Tax=Fibrella arboris TaxID=3242486 RepID=UPI0035207719